MRHALHCLTFGLLWFTACDSAPAPEPTTPVPLETYLPLRLGGVDFTAQIAVSAAEQRVGLMHRESLGADQGMLFIYPEPRRMNFWMKNTLIPLDIGFFDREGTLLQVRRMFPQDLSPVASASDQIQYALEMNQGWFRTHELKPGSQLDLDLLRAALLRREVDPSPYGL